MRTMGVLRVKFQELIGDHDPDLLARFLLPFLGLVESFEEPLSISIRAG